MTLKLTESLKKNTKVDWTSKESARAKMRTIIKDLLKEYKYPPENEKGAVEKVIEQAEHWAEIEFYVV